MNIILCGSRDLNDIHFIEDSLVHAVSKIQYDNEIALSSMAFYLVNDKTGASQHLRSICTKYGIKLLEYSSNWGDLKEYPQVLKTNAQGGKYNLLAPANRNTRILTDVRNAGGGFLLAFITTQKDIQDLLGKTKDMWDVQVEILKKAKDKKK